MTTEPSVAKDRGLSLIEVIVAIVLTGILSGVIVMIFVNSWRTQEDVVSVSGATNTGQLVGSTIERAMRNALQYEVSPGGNVLTVRTSLEGELACQGFQFLGGEAQISMSSGLLSPPSDWPQWQDGIRQRGSIPFFTDTGDAVTYTFDIGTASAPVRFSGEAALRTPLTGESAPCW